LTLDIEIANDTRAAPVRAIERRSVVSGMASP
jgi:hypothetical protein